MTQFIVGLVLGLVAGGAGLYFLNKQRTKE